MVEASWVRRAAPSPACTQGVSPLSTPPHRSPNRTSRFPAARYHTMSTPISLRSWHRLGPGDMLETQRRRTTPSPACTPPACPTPQPATHTHRRTSRSTAIQRHRSCTPTRPSRQHHPSRGTTSPDRPNNSGSSPAGNGVIVVHDHCWRSDNRLYNMPHMPDQRTEAIYPAVTQRAA